MLYILVNAGVHQGSVLNLLLYRDEQCYQEISKNHDSFDKADRNHKS